MTFFTDASQGVGLRHPLNRQLLGQLRGYRSIVASDGLWIWHYMGNLGFPLAPYPYYSLLADDIGALHEEGVSGYFAQAAAAGGADMSELRSFLIGRKTVDPWAPEFWGQNCFPPPLKSCSCTSY